jgi:hypothetical protein
MRPPASVGVTPITIEQSLIELFFELAHLVAQRGLGNRASRRLWEAEIGDVREVIKLFEIHCIGGIDWQPKLSI